MTLVRLFHYLYIVKQPAPSSQWAACVWSLWWTETLIMYSVSSLNIVRPQSTSLLNMWLVNWFCLWYRAQKLTSILSLPPTLLKEGKPIWKWPPSRHLLSSSINFPPPLLFQSRPISAALWPLDSLTDCGTLLRLWLLSPAAIVEVGEQRLHPPQVPEMEHITLNLLCQCY